MRTIIGRTRKDGSKAFTDQIVIKKGGAIVHRESQSFDRKQAANAWIVKREVELKRPGGLDQKEDPKFAVVIDRYIANRRTQSLVPRRKCSRPSRTAVLETSSAATSRVTRWYHARVSLQKTSRHKPVATIFPICRTSSRVARPAWSYPLAWQEFDDAVTVLKKLGLIYRGAERSRRPTLEELDRLMEHFGRIQANRPSSIPMQKIVSFALFSTRRQEEITLLRWEDLDRDQILVRDMKHSGDKKGNNVFCDLPAEATARARNRLCRIRWHKTRKPHQHCFYSWRNTTAEPLYRSMRFAAISSGILSVGQASAQALRGDLALPIVRIEISQKSQRGVHLVDLAAYIDNRRAAAVKECCQLSGRQECEFGTTNLVKSSTKP